ncbi:MAG TPA: hypothetical protein VN602_13805 [Gemmatimonadaceae bacterium]|nr:hypothetical protein [Gemmatimonadaceae bacterium]
MDFSALTGETLKAIHGATFGSDEITFETTSGRTFRLFHSQDCCESVSVNEVIGNVEDLIGSPLTMAEETGSDDQGDIQPPEYSESFTWTFYKLATVKGYVTLRWLGESNGYYSESVDFCEVV